MARLNVTSPGLVLLEAFVLPRTEGGRITNLSVRHQIAADVPLIAGFTVRDTATKLLVRGVGPSLRMPALGVTDGVSAAVLTLYDSSGREIATNSGWPAELAAAFVQAGAFPLIAGSDDAALVVTLPPGVYSAGLASTNTDVGQALLEIYVLP